MREGAAIVLTLPDGRLVFQRRDNHPLFSPNKLAFFGGGTKQGETPHDTAIRELNEEISVNIPVDTLRPLFDERFLEATKKGNFKIRLHLFTAPIKTQHFKVFEGKGAEAYSLEEALRRSDLADPVRITLEKIKEQKWH